MRLNSGSKRIFLDLFMLLVIFIFILGSLSSTQKYKLKEVTIDCPGEEIIFSKPTDIESAGPRVFVLDSQECLVRVFSSEGKWLYNVGRYGRGPGEFIGSPDMNVAENEIALIDTEGRRVNLYGLDGSSRGEFKIGFRGHRILILSRDRFVISYIPQPKEKNVFLLHFFDRQGKKLLTAEKISSSGLGTSDFFLFQHQLIKLAGQPVLFKTFSPELAFFFDENGQRVKSLRPDPGLPIIQFQPPLRKAMKFQAVFWSVSTFNDKIYLILPGRMEDDDLGPSKRVAVLNSEGKLENIIDFPITIYRLARVDNRFFVLDESATLRLFELIEEKT